MKITSDLKTTTAELTISEVYLLRETLEIAILELSDSSPYDDDDASKFNRILAEFATGLYGCMDDILTAMVEVL